MASSEEKREQEDALMVSIKGLLAKVRERIRRPIRGQDMAEYVLILAAIGIAGYTAYVGLEGGIQGLITNVTTILKSA
jgi:Flp pilus assembly pilin Flp